ncbi:MAG: Ig-like domain repeat protein, partial [Elusimicrobiota bacterium]
MDRKRAVFSLICMFLVLVLLPQNSYAETKMYPSATSASDAPTSPNTPDTSRGASWSAWGTPYTIKKMVTTDPGVSSPQIAVHNQTTSGDLFYRGSDIFVSEPLKAQMLSSGTVWEFAVKAGCDNADNTDDNYVRVALYVWRGGVKALDIIPATTHGTGFGNAASTATYTFNNVWGSSTTLQDNDTIVFEVEYYSVADTQFNKNYNTFYNITGVYVRKSDQNLDFFTSPNITSIVPTTLGQGCVNELMGIKGSDLQSDDVIEIYRDGVKLTEVNIYSTQMWVDSITCRIDIPYTVPVAPNTVLRCSRLANSTLNDEEPFTISSYPVTGITLPTASQIYKSLPTVSGTADPKGGSTSFVWVRVMKTLAGDDEYWIGSGWTTSPSGDNEWLAVTPADIWNYGSTGVGFDSANSLYNITGKTKNSYGGIENIGSGVSFRYDADPPTTNISIPQNNLFSGQTFTYTGTSVDNSYSYGFGISSVQIKVQDQISYDYWQQGTGWVGSELYAWNVCTDTGPWSYTIPASSWTVGRYYTINIRAVDIAENISALYSTSTYVYDTYYYSDPTEYPNSRITAPADGAYRGVTWLKDTGIQGTASDNLYGGIDFTNGGVKYAIKCKGGTYNDKWWAVDNWQTDQYWNSIPGTEIHESGSANAVGKYYNATWAAKIASALDSNLWPDNISFDFISKARDIVSTSYSGPNYEIVFNTISFTLDRGVASSTITYPDVNVSIYVPAQPLKFEGIMEDTLSGIATSGGVKVVFQRLSDGAYYNSTNGWGAWSEALRWNNAQYDITYGTWTFQYNYTTHGNLTSGDYNIVCKAKDNAENEQFVFTLDIASITVTVDATAPNTMVTLPPSDDLYFKDIGTISGTAYDAAPDKVYVQIKDLAYSTTYWSGHLNQWGDYPSSTWTTAGTWTPWTIPNVTFTAGHRYMVKCYAIDKQNNSETEALGDTKYFYYDNSTPASLVTLPVNGNTYISLPSISGTTNDDDTSGTTYDAGINKVYVQITKGGDTQSWNNTTQEWVSGLTTWNDALAVSGGWLEWKFTVNGSPFETGFTYRIRSRAKDNAIDALTQTAGNGNKEFDPNPTQGEAPYTSFIFDPTPPTSLILYPTAGDTRIKINSALNTISGTIKDTDGMVRTSGGVYLNIWRVGETYAWNGTTWEDKITQTAAEDTWVVLEGFTGNNNYTPWTDSATWNVTMANTDFTDGKQYRVRVKAYDKAGNYDVVWSTRTFYCDRSAPTSRVTVPLDGAYKNTAIVTISGTCSGTQNEDVPASVDNMKLKLYFKVGETTWWWTHTGYPGGSWVEDTEPDWRSVQSMDGGVTEQVWYYSNTSLSWTDSTTYYVTIKCVDKAANEQTPQLSSFWYDVSKPTVAVTMPNQSVMSTLSTISGTSWDQTAGFNTDDTVQIRIQALYQGATYWDCATQTWVESLPETWNLADSYTGNQWNKVWQLYNNLPAEWTPDVNYQINVRATDKAGNVTVKYATSTFKIDPTAPTTLIQKPGTNGKMLNYEWATQTIATISGTAKDTTSQLSRVEIRIKDLTYSNTYWWTTYWAEGSSWSITSGGTGGTPGTSVNWYYNMPIASLTSGKKYTVEARAVDFPGNTDVTQVSGTDMMENILTDFTNPVSTVNVPSQNAVTKSGFVTISGTCTDPLGAGANKADINRVELRLKKASPPPVEYWDGDSWETSEPADYTDIPGGNFEDLGSGVLKWWYTFSGVWTDNARYEVVARAIDDTVVGAETALSGNVEWSYGAPPNVRTFYYDQTPPQSWVSNVTDLSYKKTLDTISGTTSDQSSSYSIVEVTYVVVNVVRLEPTPMKTWTGGAWTDGDLQTNAYWRGASFVGYSSGTWTYPSGGDTKPGWEHGAKYRVVSKAWDKAQNYEVNLNTVTFYYDEYQSGPPENPGSDITSPSSDYHINDWTKIMSSSGTSVDNDTGKLYKVKVLFRRFTDSATSYWTNTWNDIASVPSAVTWPEAAAVDGAFNSQSENWYFNGPQSEANWVPNIIYCINTEAWDDTQRNNEGSGNYEVSRTTHWYVFDTAIPTGTITSPTSPWYIANTGKIEGTCADSAPGIVQKVMLRLKRTNDSHYWDWDVNSGSWTTTGAPEVWNEISWTAAVTSGTLSTNATWWQFGSQPWENNKSYQVDIRVYDKATNMFSNSAVYTTTITFSADFENPSSTITLPNEGITSNSLPTISGTCSDVSPGQIAGVKLQIKYTGNSFGDAAVAPGYWNGTDWQNDEYWLPVTSITLVLPDRTTWYYDNGGAGCNSIWAVKGNAKCFDIRAYAVDAASNTSSYPSDGVDFKYETPPPITRVTLPQYQDPYYHTNVDINSIEGTANSYTTLTDVCVQVTSTAYNWCGTSFSATSSQYVWLGTATYTAANPNLWTFDSSGISWVHNTSYTVISRGFGPYGYEATPQTNIFMYDDPATGKPDSWLVTPAANTPYYKELATITGTAADANNLGKLYSLKVAIQRTSDNNYWIITSSSWLLNNDPPDSEAVFNTATLAEQGVSYNWQVILTSVPFVDGTQYRVWSKVTDQAGNAQNGYIAAQNKRDFIFDTSSPTAKIIVPVHGSTITALTTITGTAWDNLGTGVLRGTLYEKVKIQIKENIATPNYWKGSSFGLGATWVTGTVEVPNISYSSWTLVFDQTKLTHNRSYTILVSAFDNALPGGNTQYIYVAGDSSVTFKWDNEAPVVTITYPPGSGSRYNLLSMTYEGTATDVPAGVVYPDGVRIRLKRFVNETTSYWNGSGWQGTEPGSLPEATYDPDTSNWQMVVNDLPSDQWYNISAKGIDNAGKEGTLGAGYDFMVDTTPPVSLVQFPVQNKFYKSVTLDTVSGTANGALAGLSKVEVKVSSWNVATSEWLTVINWHDADGGTGAGNVVWSSTWQPTGGWKNDVKYAVESRATDLAGNTQVVVSSNICIVDNTTPSLTQNVPVASSNWNILGITSGTATDSGSWGQYIDSVTVAIERLSDNQYWNGSNAFNSESAVYSTATLTLPKWEYDDFYGYMTGNINYKFYYRIYDAAGNSNVGSETSVTVTKDTTTPSCTILYPVNGNKYQSVLTISGTAVDYDSNGSRTDKVWIRVIDIAGNLEWNPNKSPSAGWDSLQTDASLGYIKATLVIGDADWNAGANEWRLPYSWSAADVTWSDNKLYSIEVKTRDRALKTSDVTYTGNWQTVATTIASFTIDQTTPTLGIELPAYAAGINSYSSLPTITGTSNDSNANASGVNNVKVVVRDLGTQLYWKGTYSPTYDNNWQDAIERVSVLGTVTWSTATAAFTSNRKYKIWAEVHDNAGNDLEYDIPTVGGYEFRFDNTEPTSRMTLPASLSSVGPNSSLTAITGTAVDGSDWNSGYESAGVGFIKIKVRRSNDNWATWTFWQGGGSWSSPSKSDYTDDPGFTINVTGFSTSGDVLYRRYVWNLTPNFPVEDNYQYEVQTRATDLTSPVKTESAVYGSTFTYDSTTPTSRVTKPPISGSAYDRNIATISGTAEDLNTMASDVSTVYISIARLSGATTVWWGGWVNNNFNDGYSQTWATATIVDTYTSSVTWKAIPGSALWEDTTSYWVISRAKDNAANYETGWTSTTFICDITPPNAEIEYPTNDTVYDIAYLTSISGTASDVSPGQVNNVKISIKCIDATASIVDKFWNGLSGQSGSWIADPGSTGVWVNIGNITWNYNTTAVSWESDADGVKYRVEILPYDSAYNVDQSTAAIEFWAQSPLPVTSVTMPGTENDKYYKFATTITFEGAANDYTKSDNPIKPGVAVEVRISSEPGYTTYWSTPAMSWGAAYWNQTTFSDGANYWSIPVSSDAWVDNIRYLVQSKGYGPAGSETPGSRYFYIDRTAPLSHIVVPSTGSFARVVYTITGTAIDTTPGKVDSVQLSIRRGSDWYYSGAAWAQGAEQWLTASAVDGTFDTTSDPWTYTVTYPTECWATEGTYYIRSRAKDKSVPSGNTQDPASEISFVIDRSSPTTGLIYPSAYLVSTLSSISGTVNDTPADGKWQNIRLKVLEVYNTWYWQGLAGWDTPERWTSSGESDNDTNYRLYTTSWAYANITWNSGYKYRVKQIAVDKASNVETEGSWYEFLYDIEAPTSTVNLPTTDDRLNYTQLSQITGTARDFTAREWVSVVSTAIAQNDGVNIAFKAASGFYQGGGDWTKATHEWYTTNYDSTTYLWTRLTNTVGTFINNTTPADGTYQIIARAKDNAGNYEVNYNTRTFIWDNTAPTSFTNYPSSGSYIDSFTNLIEGTCSDALAGMREIKVYFYYSDEGTDYYYTGSTWTTDVHFRTVSKNKETGTISWSLAVSSGLVDGEYYAVKSVALDWPNNTETSPKTIYFTSDKSYATVNTTYPVTTEYYGGSSKQVNVIAGTATDTTSGINRVNIRIREGSNYWDGDSWEVNPSTWMICVGSGTGTVAWYYNTQIPTWESGKKYYINSRAYDNSITGNLSPATTIEFTYDTQYPTAAVTTPNLYYERVLTTISGTAKDLGDSANNSGFNSLQVLIQKNPPAAAYWNGTNFDENNPDSAWQTVSGLNYAVGNTSVNPSTYTNVPNWSTEGSGPYLVRMRATDRAGNTSANILISSFTFVFDNTVAESTVTYPANNVAYQSLVTISGTMYEGVSGINYIQIAIANQIGNFWDGSGYNSESSSWNYVTVYQDSWTYTNTNLYSTPGNNTYNVHVRAVDNAGNSQSDPSDFLAVGRPYRVDYSSPTSAVTSITAGTTSYYQGGVVTIAGDASDTAGGAIGTLSVKIRIKRSNQDYYNGLGGWDQNAPSIDFPIPSSNGTSWSTSGDLSGIFEDGYLYEVQSRAKDASSPQNVQVVYSTSTFIIDKSSPTATVEMPTATARNYKLFTDLYGNLAETFVSQTRCYVSSVTTTQISVKQHAGVNYSEDKYFRTSDNTFQATTEYLNTAYTWTSSWTYTMSNSYWVDNTSYSVRVKVFDRAGNYVFSNSTYFVFDTSAPLSMTNLPIENTADTPYESLPTISGTAKDLVAGELAKMDFLQITLEKVPGSGVFWTGSTWGSETKLSTTLNGTVGVTTWTFSTSGVLWSGALTQYRVKSYAFDLAGSTQTTFMVRDFYYRPPPPKTVATSAVEGRYYKLNNPDSVSGSQENCSKVEIAILRNDGAYKDYYYQNVPGDYWVNSSSWHVVGITGGTWSLDNPDSIWSALSGSSVTFKSRGTSVYDESLVETLEVSPNVAVNIWFDYVNPDSVINLPVNGDQRKSLLTISGTANDTGAMIREVKVRISSGSTDWDGQNQVWTDQSLPKWSTTTLTGAGQTRTWYIVMPDTAWSDSIEYTILSRAEDNVYPLPGNQQGNGAGGTSVDFTYDIIAPTATIVVPVTSGEYTGLVTISGDYEDKSPGEKQSVEIAIQDLTEGGYYDGAGGWAGIVWISTTTQSSEFKLWADSWTYADTQITWTSGKKYLVIAKSRDRAWNWQTIFVSGTSSNTFTIDNTGPETLVTLPSSGSNFNSLTFISGTAADKPNSGANNNNVGMNVSGWVKLTIENVTDSKYYDGSNFGSTEVSTRTAYALNANLTEWRYPETGNLNWVSDKQYSVRTWSADDVGNEEDASVKYTLYYDTTPPVSRVTTPGDGTTQKVLTVIGGTANGYYTGLSKVEVKVSSYNGTSDVYTWTGSSWSPNVHWVDCANDTSGIGNATVNWTYGGISWNDGARYRIISRGYDNAGNYDIVLSTVVFWYDTSAPVSRLTVPGESGTGYYGPANTLLTLSGTSADNLSGVDKVYTRIYNETDNSYYHPGSTSWEVGVSSWLVSVDTDPWKHASPSYSDKKVYKIYSRAVDWAGNLGEWTTGTFRWDETLPKSWLTSPSTHYHNTLSQLAGTSSDAETNASGLDIEQLAIQDVGDSGLWWKPDTPNYGFTQNDTYYFTVSNTGGNWSHQVSTPTWVTNTRYLVKTRTRDRSLNISTESVLECTFMYDTSLPTSTVTDPDLSNEKSLASISGTGADTPGEVSEVSVRIKDADIGWWWDNTAGQWKAEGSSEGQILPEGAWFTYPLMNTSGNWSAWSATFTWTLGKQYQVMSRGRDKSGNYQVIYSTSPQFRYDNVAPESYVISPSNGGYIRSLSTITGTSKDAGLGGSGVNAVYIGVRNNALGSWWNGTGGSIESDNFNQSAPPVYYITITPTGGEPKSWEYTSLTKTSGDLKSGTSYYITVRSRDTALNTEDFYSIRGSTFIFDDTAPESRMALPSSTMTYVNYLPTVSGTGADITGTRALKSGVSAVNITFKDTTSGASEENKWWENGVSGGWTATQASTWTAKTADGWAVWTSTYVNDWKDGHSYELKYWSADSALPVPGNEESVNTRTFTYDITIPTASIILPVTAGYYGGPGKVLGNITGTAVDSISKVSRVEVALQEAWGSGMWYNGTSTFSATGVVWSTAEVTGSGVVKNWTYITPALIDQTSYWVKVRAVDTAGNTQDWTTEGTSENLFMYDVSLPTSVVSVPVTGGHYNTLSSITGTAKDGIGIAANMVEFGIREYPGGPWWNGSTFTVVLSTTHWVRANNAASGAYQGITWSSGTLVFQSDREYLMRTHAIDMAGNIGLASADVLVVYDITSPTATIVIPAEGGEYSGITTLSGTYDDLTPGQKQSVEFYIYDMVDSVYYNGTGGWGAQVWLSTTSEPSDFKLWADSWTYADSQLTWSSGKTYLMVAKSRDKAWNWQSVYAEGTSSNTFVIDTSDPETYVTHPAQYINTSAYISGTAADNPAGTNVGLNSTGWIKLTIQATDDSKYYTGTGFTSVDVTTLTATGLNANLTEWRYPDSGNVSWASDRGYQIRVWGKDDVDNEEDASVKYTLYYDTTPPVSRVTTPGDGTTQKTLTVIGGTANGYYTGLSKVEVKVSSYNGTSDVYTWTGSSWSPNVHWVDCANDTSGIGNATVNWTYGGISWNDGARYRIISRGYDNAGNYDIVLSTVVFWYDTSAPVSRLTVPGESGTGYYGPANTLLTLSGTSADNLSGVDKVYTRIYNETDNSYYHPGSTSWEVGVSSWLVSVDTDPWKHASPSYSDKKVYKIYSRAVDWAGNLGEWTTGTFRWDETLPKSWLTSPSTHYHNTLSQLAGTSSDAETNASGLDIEQLAIQDVGDSGLWWKPDTPNYGFTQNDTYYFTVSNTGGNWSHQVSTPTWVTNTRYLVKTRTRDRSLNISTESVLECTFMYDTSLPTSTVTDPDLSNEKSLASISGTGADTP